MNARGQQKRRSEERSTKENKGEAQENKTREEQKVGIEGQNRKPEERNTREN